jgi:hypothetical protein
MQKKEQREAAAQKEEMLKKQMANIMGKFFKPIEKSLQVKLNLTKTLIIKFLIVFRKMDKQQQQIIIISINDVQICLMNLSRNRFGPPEYLSWNRLFIFIGC